MLLIAAVLLLVAMVDRARGQRGHGELLSAGTWDIGGIGMQEGAPGWGRGCRGCATAGAARVSGRAGAEVGRVSEARSKD
jgi:hypothetical protein